MRIAFRLVAATAMALGLLAGTASAQDQAFKMDEIFTSPLQATHSDLAFWGDHAFVGYYTGDGGSPAGSGPRGGVRIFDISDPADPIEIKNFACDGLQADPIVWDR